MLRSAAPFSRSPGSWGTTSRPPPSIADSTERWRGSKLGGPVPHSFVEQVLWVWLGSFSRVAERVSVLVNPDNRYALSGLILDHLAARAQWKVRG